MASPVPVPICKLMFTSITNSMFDKPDVCLVISQNSVSCRNFGCVEGIVEKYPYSDVAGLRQAKPIMPSYSIANHRDGEGYVHLKKPKIYGDGPVVSTLITQYGIGRPVEDNNIAQKIIKSCPDAAITSHLKKDSMENRVNYFNKCMFNLAQLLRTLEYSYIKNIIIPVGIGRSAKVDDIWLTKYLPLIFVFCNDMKKYNKRVILTMSQSSETDAIYESCNGQAAVYYKELKSLPVLTFKDFVCDVPLPTYSQDNTCNNDDDDDYDDDLPNTIPYNSVY